MNKPIILGVAGGTASGKTTVSRKILDTIGEHHIAHIEHDAYYRDLSHLPLEQRLAVNFDHPDSLENELLVAHLELLRQGYPVDIPIYDFAQFIRTDRRERVESKPVILLEGILLLADATLRGLIDFKIYVDTPDDLRFIRRLRRDVAERGRALDFVIEQYLDTVRPMHLEFVEPSKRYADIVIAYHEIDTFMDFFKLLCAHLPDDKAGNKKGA